MYKILIFNFEKRVSKEIKLLCKLGGILNG
jgi:hypothetical protein